ncbi:helix-turn-helix transcriptional regulator [Streptomyces sp. NPDC048717]|uniref:helix-turn-helix domain-containing protein n=1 Tax=Streptomyces sp. NPDC048717 TaxID=3154928 RepID=UPI00343FF738
MEGIMEPTCISCAASAPRTPRDVVVLAQPNERACVLTPSEVRIFRAMRNGPSFEELATQFRVSPRTAKFHVTSLKRKLGNVSRLQLCLVAYLSTLGTPVPCPSCARPFAQSFEIASRARRPYLEPA